MDYREIGSHFSHKIRIILSRFRGPPHTGRRISKIIYLLQPTYSLTMTGYLAKSLKTTLSVSERMRTWEEQNETYTWVDMSARREVLTHFELVGACIAPEWRKQIPYKRKTRISAPGFHHIPQGFYFNYFYGIFWSATVSRRTFRNYLKQSNGVCYCSKKVDKFYNSLKEGCIYIKSLGQKVKADQREIKPLKIFG
jgi:hypothetical protein